MSSGHRKQSRMSGVRRQPDALPASVDGKQKARLVARKSRFLLSDLKSEENLTIGALCIVLHCAEGVFAVMAKKYERTLTDGSRILMS